MGIVTFENDVLGRRNNVAAASVFPVQWTQVGPGIKLFSLFDFLKGISK